MEVEKLEVLYEMQRRFPDWLNPALQSIKFCRHTSKVFLEMIFSNAPSEIIVTDLNFISNDDLDGALFLPETDIVDNASVFVALDQYSLLNCVDGLFTNDGEKLINRIVNKNE